MRRRLAREHQLRRTRLRLQARRDIDRGAEEVQAIVRAHREARPFVDANLHADALTAAFTEYTAKVLKKDKQPSILEQLAKFKALVQSKIMDRVKNKDKELTR